VEGVRCSRCLEVVVIRQREFGISATAGGRAPDRGGGAENLGGPVLAQSLHFFPHGQSISASSDFPSRLQFFLSSVPGSVPPSSGRNSRVAQEQCTMAARLLHPRQLDALRAYGVSSRFQQHALPIRRRHFSQTAIRAGMADSGFSKSYRAGADRGRPQQKSIRSQMKQQEVPRDIGLLPGMSTSLTLEGFSQASFGPG
jgi:hypothetical protein